MDALKHKSLSPLLAITLAICLAISDGSSGVAQPTELLHGQFAYVESQNLYLVQGDLNKPILVAQTSYEYSVTNPHFSRDGKYLTYCIQKARSEDYATIYYLDTLTFERFIISSNASCSYDWSPDSKTLIYTSPVFMGRQAEMPEGVWAYSSETGTVEILIASEFSVIDPRWSPDGTYISYFDFCFECIGQFYTYNVETAEVREWSQKDSDWYIGPNVSWSPDGQFLAFDKAIWVYSYEGQTLGLNLASSDGQRRNEIYSSPGRSAFFPVWSPEGSRIAFASYENFVVGNYLQHRSELMIISRDGSNAKKLYFSDHEIFPQAWSPDGRYLLINESLNGTADTGPKQQIVVLDAETGTPIWKKSSYSYSSADWAPLPATPVVTTFGLSSVPLAGQTGVLFITTDYALAFFQPTTGHVERLSQPFSGVEFSISPDEKTILFGNNIISLQALSDGRISTSAVETTLPDRMYMLNWSPDAKTYTYASDDHQVWLQDTLGSRQQLPNGLFPPQWSYDGQWIAHCDDTGRLWIAETGKSGTVISQSNHCYLSWSPSQILLAYVLHPSDDYQDYASGTAYVYDPINVETKEIAQGVSNVGWSPNGKLVSINRTTWMGASSFGYEISALDPATGKELTIEEFDARMSIYPGWINQTNGYVVGSYLFPYDLSFKQQLADIVFDATANGDKFLVGIKNNWQVEVECKDLGANTSYSLLSIDLSDTSGVDMPGMGGQLSPDGNWIVLSDFDGEKTINWLAQCSFGAPTRLPGYARPTNAYFSPESEWLVMEQTNLYDDPIPTLYVQALKSGGLKKIQAGVDTTSAWLSLPESQPTALVLSSAEAPPTLSEPQTGTTDSIVMQPDSTRESTQSPLFRYLLWASGLSLLAMLIYYLWSQRSRNVRQEASLQATPMESKSFTVTNTTSNLSAEELASALQRGINWIHEGKAPEGILELQKVISETPENGDAWFWLGLASVRQKSYRTAERCFLQAKRHGHREAEKAIEWLKNQHTPAEE